jgi:hypothetical protein
VPLNGAYFGVSWWWREIEIPASMAGKRIFLHVRGAHLRAEVYLNEKLVGYSIMEELPFEAELTHAAKPGGKNVLAIRITNPWGRFDWVDGLNEQWGAVKLYRSHGFGGLDRGMTISAHEGVRIKDAWVLNTADPRKVRATAVIETPEGTKFQFVNWTVIDPSTSKEVNAGTAAAHGQVTLNTSIAENPIKGTGGVFSTTTVDSLATLRSEEREIEIPGAELWDLQSPKVYHLRVSVGTSSGMDTRTIAFGFRTFAPEGLGTNALFRLNGRRMKIYTAISWGYWGINGMWPTPELAEKEVTQAKKLNLTCLNFHRNLAKEDVLRAHDRLGLLRYMDRQTAERRAGECAVNCDGKSYKCGGQVCAALHVCEVRGDGEGVPLASVGDRVLCAERNWRRPEESRHDCRAGGDAQGRPKPLRRAERWVCGASTEGRAGVVCAVG